MKGIKTKVEIPQVVKDCQRVLNQLYSKKHDSRCIDIEIWKYSSGDEKLQFKYWEQNRREWIHTDTFTDLIKEIENKLTEDKENESA